MPAWFIDIESATEMEAKSNGTPPSSLTAAAASRANFPSSALHGVTRPSVDATPMKGLSRSASERPRPRRNARCGARSSPSTVMRDGSFFVFTHDLFYGAAVRQAKLGRALGQRRLRRCVEDFLQLRIRLESHLAARLCAHGVPHLAGGYANAGKEHGALRAQRLRFGNALEGAHHLGERDAGKPCLRRYGTHVIAPRKRLTDDGARPT